MGQQAAAAQAYHHTPSLRCTADARQCTRVQDGVARGNHLVLDDALDVADLHGPSRQAEEKDASKNVRDCHTVGKWHPIDPAAAKVADEGAVTKELNHVRPSSAHLLARVLAHDQHAVGEALQVHQLLGLRQLLGVVLRRVWELGASMSAYASAALVPPLVACNHNTPRPPTTAAHLRLDLHGGAHLLRGGGAEAGDVNDGNDLKPVERNGGKW